MKMKNTKLVVYILLIFSIGYLIYNYLTNYNRKDYYVPVHFNAEELSKFFSEDRDYDMQHYAKKYFEQDYDYGYDYECYDFDTYYFDMINRVNVFTNQR